MYLSTSLVFQIITLLTIPIYVIGASQAAIDLVTVSINKGKTWTTAKLASIPAGISEIQLKTGKNVLVTAPACARELTVWCDRDTNRPFGIDWKECDMTSTTKSFTVKSSVPILLPPRWRNYVKEPRFGVQNVPLLDEETRKKVGFFTRYGIWIMLFIGAALARGIQRGLEELREEAAAIEEEERQKRVKKQKQPRTTVVVPRRKESVRSRNRAAPSK